MLINHRVTCRLSGRRESPGVSENSQLSGPVNPSPTFILATHTKHRLCLCAGPSCAVLTTQSAWTQQHSTHINAQNTHTTNQDTGSLVYQQCFSLTPKACAVSPNRAVSVCRSLLWCLKTQSACTSQQTDHPQLLCACRTLLWCLKIPSAWTRWPSAPTRTGVRQTSWARSRAGRSRPG